MQTITAKFAIPTPMFLGDAHQKSSSIRPPSVKGALRFWWRALVWESTFARAKGDCAQALKNLHADETRVFGSAVEDQKGGQGIFLLSVDNSLIDKNTFSKPQNGHQYLLGQGLWSPGKGGSLNRDPLGTGTFTLKVLFKPNSKIEDQRSLTQAILLWGLLGGLGSRARKGFGSVAIQSIEADGMDLDNLKVPQNAAGLKSTLIQVIGECVAAEPPFTAFSKDTRIDISQTGRNALNLLNDIGNEMQMHRSFGRNGEVNGKPAEQNFRDDHDLAQAAAAGSDVKTHPRRVAFGLPHNYFFSSTKNKLDVEPIRNGRRGSPLFIHIHQFPDGKCCAIQTFLPALFLPDGDKIAMKGRGRPQPITPNIDWSVITKYMDRFDKNTEYEQVIS